MAPVSLNTTTESSTSQRPTNKPLHHRGLALLRDCVSGILHNTASPNCATGVAKSRPEMMLSVDMVPRLHRSYPAAKPWENGVVDVAVEPDQGTLPCVCTTTYAASQPSGGSRCPRHLGWRDYTGEPLGFGNGHVQVPFLSLLHQGAQSRFLVVLDEHFGVS